MIPYENNGILLEPGDSLPDLRHAKFLYLDFETTSEDPELDSLNPWFHCKIAGICVTADDNPHAWYIPIRGRDGCNLEYTEVKRWLAILLQTCTAWVNHNVKYDAHVCLNEGIIDRLECQLIDTMTLAKIIDSDRVLRGGYSLTALSKTWLEEDISPFEDKLNTWLKGAKSKDYGTVPIDIIGPYGCQDALTTRKLYKYIQEHIPEQCQGVVATEIKLTSALCDIEQEGMPVDEIVVKKTTFATLARMLHIEEELHHLTEITIRPHTNDDCYEVLCGKYGLPILGRTDKENPSFDKAALASYSHHPDVIASANLTRVVALIMEYRKLHTLYGFFLKPYAELTVNGIIHPNYNQAVRTGRMSCSQPNAQQLSPEAKALVVPRPGFAFLNSDYSQLEFRLIVHYLNNLAAIAAYAADPWTDFHQWVADMCGISRSPAKSINFCIGFGGGRNRVLTMLAANMELIKEVSQEIQATGRSFEQHCKTKARHVFSKYHDTLPELKETSWRVAKTLERRGYVFNLYGRHRHLPIKASFRAFNSIVQASAADMIKEAVVATSPRFNSEVRALGVTQVACVHDNILFNSPLEQVDELKPIVMSRMEHPSISLRVPMKVDINVSQESWRMCG